MTKRKVLIVDADHGTIGRLSVLFAKNNIEPHFSLTAREALEKTQTIPYNAVLVANNLTDMPWQEFLKIMKDLAQSPDLPVLALLESTDRQYFADLAKSKLVTDIILCPFDPAELQRRLCRLFPLDSGNLRSAGNEKVMVVDDDETFLHAAGKMLIKHGYAVSLVSSGLEATNKMREWHPQILLLDIHLGSFEGFNIMRVMQKDPALKNIPVLVMSGIANPRNIDQSMALGAKGFMVKPLDYQLLFTRLRNILDSLPKDERPPASAPAPAPVGAPPIAPAPATDQPQENSSPEDIPTAKESSGAFPKSARDESARNAVKSYFSKINEIVSSKTASRKLNFIREERLLIDFSYYNGECLLSGNDTPKEECLAAEADASCEGVLSLSEYIERLTMETLGRDEIEQEKNRIGSLTKQMTELIPQMRKLQAERRRFKSELLADHEAIKGIRTAIEQDIANFISGKIDAEIEDLQRLLCVKLGEIDRFFGLKKQESRRQLGAMSALLEEKTKHRVQIYDKAIAGVSEVKHKTKLQLIKQMDAELTHHIESVEKIKKELGGAQDAILQKEVLVSNFSPKQLGEILQQKLSTIETFVRLSHDGRSQIAPVKKADLAAAMARIFEFDPRLTQLRLTQIKGMPQIVLLPYAGRGGYEPDLHVLFFPVWCGDAYTAVLETIAAYRLENDRRVDNYALEKEYAKLYSRATKFPIAFTKDYVLWMTEGVAGRKGGFNKKVLEFFLWNIGPDPYDFVLPPDAVEQELRHRGELEENDPNGCVLAAWCHWQDNMYQESIRLLEQADRLQPQNFRTLFNLALSYLKLDDLENAQSYLNKALACREQSLYLLQAQEIFIKVNASIAERKHKK